MKLTAVSCPPVVEVKIKRPDTKYQLGFSVQNGVVSRVQFGLMNFTSESIKQDYFNNLTPPFSSQWVFGLRNYTEIYHIDNYFTN